MGIIRMGNSLLPSDVSVLNCIPKFSVELLLDNLHGESQSLLLN